LNAVINPVPECFIYVGSQIWTAANLKVVTFRNGDTIPEAGTNEKWVTAGKAGKPAWCFYNNYPKHGLKYGKLKGFCKSKLFFLQFASVLISL
jgi:hypothetical protein